MGIIGAHLGGLGSHFCGLSGIFLYLGGIFFDLESLIWIFTITFVLLTFFTDFASLRGKVLIPVAHFL